MPTETSSDALGESGVKLPDEKDLSHGAESDTDTLMTLREDLQKYGYKSVFEVVREGRQQVTQSLAREHALANEQAEAFYMQAQARAASLVRLYQQLGARGEPAMRHLNKLEVEYDAAWMARALNPGANYDDWFNTPGPYPEYAHPDSVGSLFSPGSYLTTLYRVAKELHDSRHDLRLDKRRPDLQNLTLSDTHLKQELSTLALTLEVLEAGVDATSTTPPGQSVEERLRKAVYPMTLPYNHAAEQIRQGLAVKKMSVAQLLALLHDHRKIALTRGQDMLEWQMQQLRPWFVQDVLGLHPELYAILIEQDLSLQSNNDALRKKLATYYGVPHAVKENLKTSTQLQASLRLPRERILEVLGTGPFYDDLVRFTYKASPDSVQFEKSEPGTYAVIPRDKAFPIRTFDGSIEIGIAQASNLAATWVSAQRLDLHFLARVVVQGGERDNFDWFASVTTAAVEMPAAQPGQKAAPDREQNKTIRVLLPNGGIPEGGTNVRLSVQGPSEGGVLPPNGQGDIFLRTETPVLMHLAHADDIKVVYSAGIYVLHFQSTVQTNGQDASANDYRWSLEMPGRVSDTMPDAAAITPESHSRATQQELRIGDVIPDAGLTVKLKLIWNNVDTFEQALRITQGLPQISNHQQYGARYLSRWHDYRELYWYVGPHVGHPDENPNGKGSSNYLVNPSFGSYDRVHRLIRLQHKLPLSFEELDWLINAVTRLSPLKAPLEALAIYLPLRERFGLSLDTFVACIGPLNTHHRPEVPSLFAERFGKPQDLLGRPVAFGAKQTIPADATSLTIRAKLCQGLRIDDVVLCIVSRYLPDIEDLAGQPYLASLTLEHIAALFRLVEIPRLYGLSVLEGLALWELLSPDRQPRHIAEILAKPGPGDNLVAAALSTLARTGHLVDWMHEEALDVSSLLAMTTRQYSRVATPELLRFVENILSTLKHTSAEGDELKSLLCRHIGGELGLKANVALAMVNWLDEVAGKMHADMRGYQIFIFWSDIKNLSGPPEPPEVTRLQHVQDLEKPVLYAQLLHQFAQVCQWAQLTEQDLALLVPDGSYPGGKRDSLLTGSKDAPEPDLELLLLLSRYRRWGQSLVGTMAEARRYLERAYSQSKESGSDLSWRNEAIDELAALHGWSAEATDEGLSTAGLPIGYPVFFTQIYPLLQVMKTSSQLCLSPADLALIKSLNAHPAPNPDKLNDHQPLLVQIADKVMAAACA